MPYSQVRKGDAKKQAIWKPEHQQCGEAPTKPKYVFVNASTTMPTSCWGGQESWIEFEIPSDFGILAGLTMAIDVNNSSGTDITVLPTTFWFSRVEIFLGSDCVETVYSQQIHDEVVGFRTYEKFLQLAEAIGINKNYDLLTGNLPAHATNERFYLPLEATFLQGMRPFVKAFHSRFKLRTYFATSIHTSGTVAPTLQMCQLIAEEASLHHHKHNEVHQAHRAIVQYDIMIRERQQDALTINSNTAFPIYLRSFKNDSAGLLVNITSQSASKAEALEKLEIHDITLQDSLGNKITEQIRGDFNKPFIWTDHIDSPYTTYENTVEGASQPYGANLYLVPFSSSFSDSVMRGCDFGSFPMSTQEKLMITPANSTTLGDKTNTTGNCLITTVSYSHGAIVCANGKHYIQMKSSH